MRIMTSVKATDESEDGVMPEAQILTDLSKFNQELAKATAVLADEGLHTSKAAPVKLAASKRTVTDGPFAETKELIAGFRHRKAKSKKTRSRR